MRLTIIKLKLDRIDDMNAYDQLRKESKKLEIKINTLETWLKNNQARKTEFFNSSEDGVVVNNSPKEFIPYLTIANRQGSMYGNLIFHEGDFELDALLEATIPVLETLHNECCDKKQAIDLKLQAIDELLRD